MNQRLFQQDFAAALVATGPDASLPDWTRQPGFAVYRNTVLKGCIDTLLAHYPAVTRLVGEAWMRGACAVYAGRYPPTDACLLDYGRDFALFLQSFGPAAELPYLPAVAWLDRCWTEVHTAADAPARDPGALAALAPETLGQQRLRPHPAARWAWCGEHPAFSIWSRSRAMRDEQAEPVWTGEGALLTRPAGAVAWQALPHAGCAFLAACATGLPLAAAAQAALEADAEVDLAALLAGLLQAGAFTALAGVR
ncbi:MAG: DNA-binding domain-containing protein [Pseudomonadota bacterium]